MIEVQLLRRKSFILKVGPRTPYFREHYTALSILFSVWFGTTVLFRLLDHIRVAAALRASYLIVLVVGYWIMGRKPRSSNVRIALLVFILIFSYAALEDIQIALSG